MRGPPLPRTSLGTVSHGGDFAAPGGAGPGAGGTPPRPETAPPFPRICSPLRVGTAVSAVELSGPGSLRPSWPPSGSPSLPICGQPAFCSPSPGGWGCPLGSPTPRRTAGAQGSGSLREGEAGGRRRRGGWCRRRSGRSGGSGSGSRAAPSAGARGAAGQRHRRARRLPPSLRPPPSAGHRVLWRRSRDLSLTQGKGVWAYRNGGGFPGARGAAVNARGEPGAAARRGTELPGPGSEPPRCRRRSAGAGDEPPPLCCAAGRTQMPLCGRFNQD